MKFSARVLHSNHHNMRHKIQFSIVTRPVQYRTACANLIAHHFFCSGRERISSAFERRWKNFQRSVVQQLYLVSHVNKRSLSSVSKSVPSRFTSVRGGDGNWSTSFTLFLERLHHTLPLGRAVRMPLWELPASGRFCAPFPVPYKGVAHGLFVSRRPPLISQETHRIIPKPKNAR
jgi:hypothetical protein